MIVSVSIPRVVALISQMEGRAVELAEVESRPQRFAGRLRQYLSDTFGILLSGYTDAGNTAHYRAVLQTTDRQQIVDGIAWLNPLAIRIEVTDLDALVPITSYRAALKDNFATIAGDLQQLGVDDWLSTFERVGQKLIFAAREPHESAEQGIVQTVQFEEWCRANGLRVPAAQTPRQLRTAEEVRQRKAAERPFIEHESDWHVREMP